MMPRVNKNSSFSNWDSEMNQNLFNVSFSDHKISAIDAFILKNVELNTLIIDPSGRMRDIESMIDTGLVDQHNGRIVLAELSKPNTNPTLLNLILLGYISSVEAYFRKLLRDLINIDHISKKNCELHSINFGATYYQTKELYPEALMEGSNFIRSDAIINECKKLLGINLQIQKSSSLDIAMKDFDHLCQLRHCIVHRFGKIGVNNIIKLGLHSEDYGSCIEKPISMNFNSIQKASKVTVNLVREINHELWSQVMNRLVDPPFWVWDFRTDKSNFRSYLSIFYESSIGSIDTNIKNIYDNYRKSSAKE